MKIGSLFSGIGGLELGLELAGIGQVARRSAPRTRNEVCLSMRQCRVYIYSNFAVLFSSDDDTRFLQRVITVAFPNTIVADDGDIELAMIDTDKWNAGQDKFRALSALGDIDVVVVTTQGVK